MIPIAYRHYTYLALEAFFIGSVAGMLIVFHFRFLWTRLLRILLGMIIVMLYTLPVDAYAVAHAWGGFYPQFVSGIYLFGSTLLLEEVVFWAGTSLVTVSAVMILAEAEKNRVPWYLMPIAVFIPLKLLLDALDLPDQTQTRL